MTAGSGVKPEQEAVDDDRDLPEPSPLRRMLSTAAIYVLAADVVLFLVFTLISQGHLFATGSNVASLLRYATEALVLSLAFAMMLGAGMFDLSLGANLVLSSVVGGLLLRSLGAVSSAGPASGHLGAAILAVPVCIAAGAVFGLVNGLVITVLRVNSLIATLGTLGVGTALSLIFTNGSDISGVPSVMETGFGLKTLGVVPVPMIVAIVLALVLWAVQRLTRFGLRSLAIGSSSAAAERAGLRPGRYIVGLAVIGGALAGLAGYIDLATFGQTDISGHQLDALSAATAVIIGGAALTGGRVSIPGTIWGAMLSAILLDGLIVIGVPSFYQQLATGAVLIAAVAVSRLRDRHQRT
jgi:ribose transport system permease protein